MTTAQNDLILTDPAVTGDAFDDPEWRDLLGLPAAVQRAMSPAEFAKLEASGRIKRDTEGKFDDGPGVDAGAAKDVAGFFKSKNYQRISTGGHIALDVIGLLPGWGEPADLTNAAWYLAEGNVKDALLSAASAVPLVGWGPATIKAAKHIRRVRRLITIANVAKDVKNATEAKRSKRTAFGIPLDKDAPKKLAAELHQRWGTDPRPWAILHAHLSETVGEDEADDIIGSLYVAANGEDTQDPDGSDK